MKVKINYLFFLLGIFSTSAVCQNINDIVNMNAPIQMGTARFMGTAGAFTALGNDFSSVHLNPAAIAVFRHDEFGLSLGLGTNTVNSVYYDETILEKSNTFLFNNIGYVKTNVSEENEFVFSFGISFNKNHQLNQVQEAYGINPNSTVLENWIYNANGTPPTQLLENGLVYELLAFETFLMDDEPDNSYSSQAKFNTTTQLWREEIKGRFDEISISLGAHKNDKIYLGASLNIPIYSYKSSYYFAETGYEGGVINGLKWFEDFTNQGVGINIKAGAIYRPTPNFRIGASVFSPSWFSITQTYSTSVVSDFISLEDVKALYEPDEDFIYGIQTAPQTNLGLAYVFNKSGLVSLDYTFIPTKWSRTGNNDLSYLNSDIKEFLLNQHSIKFGAEIRLRNIFIRGGYSWFSNPYNFSEQDGTQTTIALGMGYRTNKFNIDLAYSVQTQAYNYYPYSPEMVEPAYQTIQRKPLIISASFKL